MLFYFGVEFSTKEYPLNFLACNVWCYFGNFVRTILYSREMRGFRWKWQQPVSFRRLCLVMFCNICGKLDYDSEKFCVGQDSEFSVSDTM